MDPAWRQGTRLAFRLALSHHPLCGWFDRHTVNVRGAQVCKGCAATLSAFVAGLLLAIPLLPAAPTAWLGVGLVLGIPHLASYRMAFGNASRIAAKMSGGLGLGVVFAAGAALPAAWSLKLLALLGMEASFLVLQAARLRKMRRVCSGCVWKGDWGACPGFNP
jgi:hypothetical protein